MKGSCLETLVIQAQRNVDLLDKNDDYKEGKEELVEGFE